MKRPKTFVEQGIDADRTKSWTCCQLRDWEDFVPLLERAILIPSTGRTQNHAQSFGINVIAIDLSVVRGLSYYTGTVWELFDTAGSVPRPSQVVDDTIDSLNHWGSPLNGGFGFGDVVVTLLLEEKGLLPKRQAVASDVIYPMSQKNFPCQ